MAAANIAALGFITAGAAVAFAATAAADPPPPAPDPAPAPAPPPLDGPLSGATMPVMGAPLGPQGLDVLAQTGQDGNPAALGLPQGITGMDWSTVLGQNAVPSPPGANPGAVPNLNPFNNAYGPQQCLKPSAPGKCEEFGVAPGDENADVTRRQWLGRFFDMQRAGLLKGGMIGQMPQEQLGEPLPGTAPPPGTRIPPGLDQFQPDPADAAPPAGAPPAPPPPGAPLLPPPPG